MNKFEKAFVNKNQLSGRALYVDGDTVWSSQGRRLMWSSDLGQTWCQRAVLPVRGIHEYLAGYRIGRRLGRVGFHHLALAGENLLVFIAHNNIFQLAAGEREIEYVAPLVGSRPLKTCVSNNLIYYGEYRSNKERSPVHIWAAAHRDLRNWVPVWTFEKVRHVHGVFYDPYTSAIWVTTGDENEEASIWVTHDYFQTLSKVLGGSQKFRIIQLLFSANHIYFGSDALQEKNYIYRMNRRDQKIEQLSPIQGTVFHGCKVKDCLFFSTAVEPSTFFTSPYAEVWGSCDGVTWKMVQRFRKDCFHMKLFQYGQVFFPAGPGDDKNLWCTPMSTEYDQTTIKIPIDLLFT